MSTPPSDQKPTTSPASTSATTPAAAAGSFGAAGPSATPSFNFGPAAPAVAPTSTPAPASPSQSFSFGGQSSFTFGGASTASSSSSSSLPSGTAASSASTFSFGAASPAASTAFAGKSSGVPAAGFGTSAASPATGSSLFGASTTGGVFGAAVAPRAPAIGGFGTPVAAASSTTSGFGAAPATTAFGASAGGGFGSFGSTSAPAGFGNRGLGHPPTPAATGFSWVGRPTAASATASAFTFGIAAATSSSSSSSSSFSFTPAATSLFHTAPTVEKLFNRSDLFPDVILSYQGQDIHAHRAILALASPKFKKLFNETEEPARQGGLPVFYLEDHISGLQYTDVSRIINYCYTGQFVVELPIPRLIQIAMLAEEFNISTLSLICQRHCIDQLNADPSVDTILEALEEAHKNELVMLKKACMDSLMRLPAESRFKTEDLTRLDKDLLTEFLVHVTTQLSIAPSTTTGFGGWGS